MVFQTTLHYNKTLIRQSAFSFWRRAIGFRFFVALALVASLLGYNLHRGDRSWFVGALATVVFISVAFPIAIYWAHYRNGLIKFKALGLPQASFSATESSFTFESGAGSSTLPWASVTEIWQFDAYWLMLFSKAQFVTLPLTDMSAEFRAFILQRVRASGGVIL
jgi:hypothetical protein